MAEAAQPVSFAMVNDEFYADSTLEPGMVRIRESNSSKLYTNSVDSTTPGLPPTSCTVSSPDNTIILQRIKRYGVTSAAFHHSTPIINETNNVIQCYDLATNTVVTITIPPGNYNTPQQLITAFQTAKTASGLATAFQYTFRGATPPPYLAGMAPTDDAVVLLVTSTPVLFLPNSKGVRRGRSTFNWIVADSSLPEWDGINPVNPTLASAYTPFAVTEQLIGPMKCCYTQYVDITSRTMSRWAKLNNISTTLVNHNLIHRIYMPDFKGYSANPGIILVLDDRAPPQVPTPIIYEPLITEIVSVPSRFTYMTLQPRESVTTIDFTFIDEYGTTFYVPPFIYSYNPNPVIAARIADDSEPRQVNAVLGNQTGGLSWNVNFYCEL
jgi:hypothetical protein